VNKGLLVQMKVLDEFDVYVSMLFASFYYSKVSLDFCISIVGDSGQD
jgi:uncharacterized membrane protein YcgQ (UPF0703/DUF1980 family)